MDQAAPIFKRLGTAVVSDVLDECGFHNNTLDPTIVAIGQSAKFCGPAICVRGERRVVTRTTPPPGTVLPLYNLPGTVSTGSVLVFATGAFHGGAVIGGMLAGDLKQAGCVGVVTDGLIRDRDELATIGLPICAHGSTPLNGARRFQIVETSVPVTLPGPEGGVVTIFPNDLVLGDIDGVILIPNKAYKSILKMALELEKKEELLMRSEANMALEEKAQARANRMSHVTWLRHNSVVAS